MEGRLSQAGGRLKRKKCLTSFSVRIHVFTHKPYAFLHCYHWDSPSLFAYLTPVTVCAHDNSLSPSLAPFPHTHTHICAHIFRQSCSCCWCMWWWWLGGATLIDRRWVSEWKADNYIFYRTFKGQTHIAVIGIFTRQLPRYNAEWREEREEEEHRRR